MKHCSNTAKHDNTINLNIFFTFSFSCILSSIWHLVSLTSAICGSATASIFCFVRQTRGLNDIYHLAQLIDNYVSVM